jgi:hypothetical protein
VALISSQAVSSGSACPVCRYSNDFSSSSSFLSFASANVVVVWCQFFFFLLSIWEFFATHSTSFFAVRLQARWFRNQSDILDACQRVYKTGRKKNPCIYIFIRKLKEEKKITRVMVVKIFV